MANLVDDSGDASSNLVAGTNTSSATFTMPGSVPLNVESVVATINNAAGGDTTATLTIKDQSGVVIATKRQGVVIPAGDTGTATFALRLTDETSAAPNLNTQREQFYEVVTARAGLSDHFDFTAATLDGADLFNDHGGADYPTVRKAGLYSFAVLAQSRNANIPNGVCAVTFSAGVNLGSSFAFPRIDLSQSFPLDKFPKNGTVSVTWYMGTGAQIDVAVLNGAAVDIDCNVYIFVQRIS